MSPTVLTGCTELEPNSVTHCCSVSISTSRLELLPAIAGYPPGYTKACILHIRG